MHVILAAIHPYHSPQAVPLANAFLKSSLAMDEGLSGKVSVTLMDFLADHEPEACAKAILDGNPDAVGLSIYLWNRAPFLKVVEEIRKVRPCLIIFAGGPEPTADPEGMLRNRAIDFLIIGEGEAAFVEAIGRLAAGKPVVGLPGIACQEGAVIRTTYREPMADIDAIPSPYLAGVLPPSSGALWQLSRGCDFACSFCFDPKGTRGIRRFSMERIREELEWFVRNRVDQVFVVDSTFNREMKRAKQILALIGRQAPQIHFHFEVRSEYIDREMADLFSRITCSIQIGLQSADPAVQKKVRRHFDRGDFVERVALLNQAGVIFGFDLIYGLPGDTLRGFERSLDFALSLFPNHLDIFPLAVLPGTELAGTADSLGLTRLTDPPYTLKSTPTFSAKDIAESALLAAATDIFYSRGKAVAWFNAVLIPLAVTPSSFLRGFARWTSKEKRGALYEGDFSDEQVWELQRGYLSQAFTPRHLRRLLPVALDLVDYNYHYAAALMAIQPELPTDRQLEQADLSAAVLGLAPGARLARFNYEIVDILESGEIDLQEFTECFSPAASWGVIYPRDGEVFTESLIEPYFNLLSRLDGSRPAGAIAAELGIPPDEAISFLEFVAAEGIAVRKGGW